MSNKHKSNPRVTLMAGVVMAASAAAFVSGAALGAEPDKPEKKADDNACVFSRTVDDWRALDSRNLIIWAPNRKDAYHVTLGFPLNDLRSSESIAVIDRDGDGRLCGYGRDEIVTHSGPMTEHAMVSGMTRVDEAGLIALGEKYKVTLVRPSKDKPLPVK